MNKLITLFLIAVSVFVCDPRLWAGTKFIIKNETEHTLNIDFGGKFILRAGETHTLSAYDQYLNIFDYEIARLNTCSVFLGNTLLRTWRHSGRNDGGKQFFNEFSWTRGRDMDDERTYVTYTFIMTPEDLGL